MAVWFLAPIAVVGAKLAWDYFNDDSKNASSSQSNSHSNTENPPRYCDINSIMNKCDYPSVELPPELKSLASLKLHLGHNLLNKTTKHLQSFYEISAMKKCQSEELAASIELHQEDSVGYVARRGQLDKYSKMLEALRDEISKLRDDISKYDRLVDELAGSVFKKIGNWFNSEDAEAAETFSDIAAECRENLSGQYSTLAQLEQSVEAIKELNAAVKFFDIESAKAIHTGLLNDIESIDNAFSVGVEQLGSQMDNLIYICDTSGVLQSLFDELNSTAFKSTLNMTFIEVEPSDAYLRHRLTNYVNSKHLKKLLHSRSKDTENCDLLTKQIKTLTDVSIRYQALNGNIDNADKELKYIKSKYKGVLDGLTTPDSEKHDLKDVFDEYNADVAAKIECFNKLTILTVELDEVDFDKKIAFRIGEVAKLKAKIALTDLKLDKVQEAISDFEVDVKMAEQEINTINRDISKLEAYNNRLSITPNENRRSKAMIHDEVEKEYGNRSPNNLIRKYTNQLESKQRTIGKLKDKIKETVAGMVQPISDILIDGNNCCYFEGNKQLGLSAIKAVIPQLSQIAKITIVFDHSIIKNLNKTEDDIRQELSFDDVDVFISPKGEIADNFLNMIADKKPDSIIVTI